MQSWITKFAVGAVALATVSLAACKKDEVRTTLTPSNAPTLTAASTTSSVVLTQANASQPAATYTWTPVSALNWSNADHPYTPPITYYLQIDKKGHSFGSPVSIAAGAGPKTTLSVGDLNSALITLGVTPGTATDLEVRLNASYASNSSTYSNALPLTATAYSFCPQPAKAWGVVGPAGPGWPGGGIDFVMAYDCNAKTYTYTGPLKADEFKFRFGKSWNTSLGGPGPTVPLIKGGDNLKITAAGTYTVTLYNAADTTSLGTAYYTIK